MPLLAGVVALGTLVTIVIALEIHNDWGAVFAFVAAMFLASLALNHYGLERADKQPHPLYKVRRLPVDGSTRWIRMALIGLTLIGLVVAVAATAKPGKTGSPLPYLLSAEFLYLALPQITARIAVRRYGAKKKPS